jgi:hypothetical protein
MVGDVEIAAALIAVGIVLGAVILGTAIVIATGRLRKRE